MPLFIECDRCGSELNEPAAVVIGPPNAETHHAPKLHLCISCYKSFCTWLGGPMGFELNQGRR